MPDIVAGVVGIVFLFVWAYCLYDVLTTDEALIRNLPKIAWFLVVLLLFDLGSILWLCLGRPRLAATRTRTRTHGPVRMPQRGPGTTRTPAEHPALDDLHPIVREREERARLRMWAAQLERRESELRRRELGDTPGF